MKFVDLKSLPQNQFLSKFLAAKYLEMSVIEFEDFISEHNIQTHQVDKFGDKYSIADLAQVVDALANGNSIPESIITHEHSEASSESDSDNEPSSEDVQKVISFSVNIANAVRRENGYVSVSRDQIKHFEKAPLYHKSPDGKFVLYKPANKILPQERIDDYRCPVLYYRDEDKDSVLDELVNSYNEKLEEYLRMNSMKEAQGVLVSITENALRYPEVKVLRSLEKTVRSLVKHYDGETNTLEMVCNVIGLDKGDAEHAVNIMNLAIKFCIRNEYSEDDTIGIALSALLHDIGKTKLEFKNVSSSGVVPNSEENQRIFEQHAVVGAELIKQCEFVHESVYLGALEHHERLTGEGYPEGKTKLSFYGQLMGILHFFEARLEKQNARRETKPLTILKELKLEVEKGKYNGQLFKQFAYSLL